jgi:hypothetical protein
MGIDLIECKEFIGRLTREKRDRAEALLSIAKGLGQEWIKIASYTDIVQALDLNDPDFIESMMQRPDSANYDFWTDAIGDSFTQGEAANDAFWNAFLHGAREFWSEIEPYLQNEKGEPEAGAPEHGKQCKAPDLADLDIGE